MFISAKDLVLGRVADVKWSDLSRRCLKASHDFIEWNLPVKAERKMPQYNCSPHLSNERHTSQAVEPKQCIRVSYNLASL